MPIDKLHQGPMHERALNDHEKLLLTALLSDRPDLLRLIEELSSCRVFDMADGGMGSVRFNAPVGRTFGEAVVKADYLDEDGVQVSIAVNLDDRGDLYEVDFWRADFLPLKQYPGPEQLRIKR